jgi:hypothetical protein
MLGSTSSLQLHHVFPKRLLYDYDYDKTEVNALANMTFLTQDTNLQISDRPPREYFPEIEQKHPGALASHWIPMDPELWRQENYLQFLEARQKLLAEAANEFLDSLLKGAVPESEDHVSIFERTPAVVGGIMGTKEEERVLETSDWLCNQGLPEGQLLYEVVDDDTGEPLAVLDITWPNGLQEGLSQPVALLLDEPRETLEAAQQAGFRYFTEVNSFKRYVERDILAVEEV